MVDGVAEKTKSGVAVSMVSPTDAVFEIVPEDARRFSVPAPGAAFEAAVRFTACVTPGVSVRLAGDAVTPAGNPERATLIVPLKPYKAVAVILTDCALPPAFSVRLAGVTSKLKLGGGGVMVTGSSVVCSRTPVDVLMRSAVVPAVAVEAAVNEICCGVPGVSKKFAGMATTPLGRPYRPTATGPVKPLIGIAERVT